MQHSPFVTPTDRPPLPLADSHASIRSVHDELDRLADQVDVTLRRAKQILSLQLARSSHDGHRDSLHLLARIEVLVHQIDHAKAPLKRMEMREFGSPDRGVALFPAGAGMG